MAHVILPWPGDPPENPAPRRSWRLLVRFLAAAVQRGITALHRGLAVVTAFVGGSGLTYAIFVAELGVSWVLLIVLAGVAAVLIAGAYVIWSEAYQAALRFSPTWEHIQTRADILRALTEEHMQRDGFKRQYMAGHMAATRRDFDRAVAAGYPPAFDRDRIGNAEIRDIKELVGAFDDVVQRWREDEGSA